MRTGKTSHGVGMDSTRGMRNETSRTSWIVVADNSRARILACTPAEPRPRLMRTMEHAEGRLHGHELVSDRPGRTFASHTKAHGGHQTGGVRHAYSSEDDPRSHETESWCGSLADFLEESLRDYDNLVVVAEPRLIGRLNAHLTGSVRERVARTIERDLSWIEGEPLVDRLSSLIENDA